MAVRTWIDTNILDGANPVNHDHWITDGLVHWFRAMPRTFAGEDWENLIQGSLNRGVSLNITAADLSANPPAGVPRGFSHAVDMVADDDARFTLDDFDFTGDQTICALVYPTTLSGNHHIFSKIAPDLNNGTLFISSS